MTQPSTLDGLPECIVAPQTGERDGTRSIAGLLALEAMHEIRNPLEVLAHLTYLALYDSDDPEKVVRYMKMAEEQMAVLNQVVSETLGFARASSTPQPSDLLSIAEAALRLHRRAIRAKKIQIVKDLPQGISAEVQTEEIVQVFSNLIVNSLDALPANGTLWVRLRKLDNHVHILIADNGHGIPAEHSETIFETSFTTKKASGVGLGLPLSRKIVERHGGRIRVRSSIHPGKCGTTFKVSLPA